MIRCRLETNAVRLLLLAIALADASCTAAGTDLQRGRGRHPYTHPHELRFAAAADIQHLNPLTGATAFEINLATLCMAYFTKRKTSLGEPEPELITEIPSLENRGLSPDGKTIVWHLRHGVTWSDGAPFDAGDVVFTTKQILNPANHVADLVGWDLIERIDEPDRYTVVYHLKKSFPRFASTFFSTAGSGAAVLPQHLLRGVRDLSTAPYNALPVGIGPFEFAAWHRGDSVVMVRNPNYFRGAPKLERIVFKIVPDQTTTLAQLRTHEIDLWPTVPSHLYRQALAIPGIAGSSLPGCLFDHLDFNLSNPILEDVRVRRALRYAVDRPKLIRVTQDGVFTLNESILTPACRFSLALPPVPFDLARANALLDAAGWKRTPDGGRSKAGRRLSLTFAMLSGRPDVDAALELMRGWWQRIGVDLTAKRYVASQFFGDAADGGIVAGGKFDVVRFAWTFGADDDLTDVYACDRFTPNGQNDAHWCDAAATAALHRAQATSDIAERRRDMVLVQRIVDAQVPTIVLDARRYLNAFNDDLKGYDPAAAPFDNIMNVDI